MSDIPRHNESEEAEEARHKEIVGIERARHSEASNTPEESEAHVREMDAKIALAQVKAKHAGYVAMSIVLTIVMLTIALAVYVVRDRASNDRLAAHKIDQLTVELNEARAARTEVDLCQSKFDGRVSAASRKANSAEQDLIVLIATVVPADRPPQVEGPVAVLVAATAAYRTEAAARDAWVYADKPLPCPI